MNYNIKDTFKFGLQEVGQKFTIHYRTSTACTYCNTADPFYRTMTNYVCSTCDGSGRVWDSTAKYAYGVINQFSKGFKYVEDGQFIHRIQPVGVVRGTFWLDDVLINKHSITGGTYLDDCATVESMGRSYKPMGFETVGYGDEYALVATFNRIE